MNVGIHVTDSDWSITTDNSHVFYARYNESWFDSFCDRALLFRAGTIGNNATVAWQPEQVVRSPDPQLIFPNEVIRVDSTGQVWIGYQQHSSASCGGTGVQTPHIVHSSGTDYSTWTSDHILSTSNSNNWDIDIATLSGGEVYAAYWINSLDLHRTLFNGPAWGPDEQVSSQSESTDVNSFVFASSNTVSAIWYDSNMEMLRFGSRQSTGQWSTNNIGNGEAKSGASLGRYSLPITTTYDPFNNQFYVFWYYATNNAIDQWSGIGSAWRESPKTFTTASAVGEYTITSYSESALVGNSDVFGADVG